jgi:hypothetical protein
MGFGQHLKTFAGLPVREFESGKRSQGGKPHAWRLAAWEYAQDDATRAGKTALVELLDEFLDAQGTDLSALVIGPWKYDDMCEGLGGRGAAEIVAALVAGAERMPNLRALFMGDVLSEECEVSWIGYGDISPLLPAFPKLEEFHLRGTSNVRFGAIDHPNLRKFVLEGGGLPAEVVSEICAARMPKLEHLELWLGDENYGGITETSSLRPLLDGTVFPKLRYLGLRNSKIADEVAKAVAESPLLERIEILDLSLGTMTEVGAEALLVSPKVRKLKRLDLFHHYISAPFVKALKALPIEVDVSDAQEPEFDTWNDVTYIGRYTQVAE